MKILDDLDICIHKISKKINKETFKTIKDKISNLIFDNNDTEVDILVDEYLNKITTEILSKQPL